MEAVVHVAAAESKIKALKDAGIAVAESPADMGSAMASALGLN